MPTLYFENPLIIRAGTVAISPFIHVYIDDIGLTKELLENMQNDYLALTFPRVISLVTLQDDLLTQTMISLPSRGPLDTLQFFISRHPELVVRLNENAIFIPEVVAALNATNIKLTPVSAPKPVTFFATAAAASSSSSSSSAAAASATFKATAPAPKQQAVSLTAAAAPPQQKLSAPTAASFFALPTTSSRHVPGAAAAAVMAY